MYPNQSPSVDKKVNKETDGKQALGKLNVNGEFELSCKLPEGYELQTVSQHGESITASILPDDMTRPDLYLEIAYDELYGMVDRMNDMSAEKLAVLEGTFTATDEIEFSCEETGYRTKLLVAREVGDDTDFVKILAIYKGYFIGFTIYPSTNVANQTLTDEQVQMCVDFLTNVDSNAVA